MKTYNQPAYEPRNTTEPDSRSRIWGRKARVTFETPKTLVLNCAIDSSGLQRRYQHKIRVRDGKAGYRCPFFDGAEIDVTCVIHDDVDLAVDCDGLLGDGLEVGEQGGNIELKYIRALHFELFDSFRNRATANCCDDLVAALESCDCEIATETG